MPNFNKLIDLKFQTSNGEAFEIKTPRKGIKPQIEISGNLTMEGYTHTFEVRITNFFSDSIEGDITDISVTAGYEGKMSAGIYGAVQNVYTESPGPDKVTVLSCISANYDAWINKTIDLKTGENFSLRDAINEVSKALEFETAIIDASVADKVCAAALNHNGRCSEALNKIKSCFPGVSIITDGKKLRVFPTEAKSTNMVLHNLELLSQPPQFSGGTVSLIAPWEPMIKPGDYVQFPIKFNKTSFGAIQFDKAMVNTIQFHFATNSDANEMIISGTPASKLLAEAK
ncbi:MAG: hypothetical protein IKY09_07630 [Methanocorpusculum sp.]|nr:hypothetical protein [Methanocorpusculum sp.]MBR5450182.1 hypothetical protein [Methanocorpusculum sp.]